MIAACRPGAMHRSLWVLFNCKSQHVEYIQHHYIFLSPCPVLVTRICTCTHHQLSLNCIVLHSKKMSASEAEKPPELSIAQTLLLPCHAICQRCLCNLALVLLHMHIAVPHNARQPRLDCGQPT